MNAKMIFMLSLLVACLLDKGINGEYICNVDGLAYTAVRKEVPGSTDEDDCSDNINSVIPNCGIGDMCQSYLQCQCTNNQGKYPPGERCWIRGTRLTTADGNCNSDIANRTAVARFDPTGRFISGSCGAFLGCKSADKILVFTQKCYESLRTNEINKGDSKFSEYYVLEKDAALIPKIGIPPNKAVDCLDVVPSQLNGCNMKVTGDVLCPVMDVTLPVP